MCGILGICARNKKGESQFTNIPEALKRLSHRGPDNSDYKIYAGLALGHTRLSIIDLSENAHQPFTDQSGRYSLVFNGEIYNYRQIRKKLEKEGVQFHTDSDTEVLLQLLIRKKERAMAELNGFFAFLFYDAAENELLVARDRFGIKPLLYYQDRDKLIFASELPAIMAFDISPEINKDALNAYFSYTYIPAPQTILSRVKKLEPGTYLKLKNNILARRRYYRIKSQPLYSGTYETAKTELDRLLHQSVEKRLIADVPVGSFLSGGLDSSIIALLAKEQKDDLRTFSIGFDHPYFNESEYAQLMASHIGTRHETIVLGREDFRQHFEHFLESIDEPFADSSAFAGYLLSAKTREQVTVSLSGDGADELFGGYRKHLAEAKIQSAGRLKRSLINNTARLLKPLGTARTGGAADLNRKVQKLAAGLKLSPVQRYQEWCKWIPDEDRKNLLRSNYNTVQFNRRFEATNMNDFLLLDQQFVLPNDMLKKVDFMSMAHALEVRVPFLDHRVVQFANSLPPGFKITTGMTKRILRDTYRDRLPARILQRSKKGFEIPLAEWLTDLMSNWFTRDFFSDKYLAEQGLFDPSFIRGVVNDLKRGRCGERIYLVWALLIFQSWYHQYVYRHD